jgi:peptide/nickel transport system substrate-binding protein
MRAIILLGGAIAAFLCVSGPALAQKSGGVLKLYHRDNPPSASIHEEATASTVVPFMPVFNNLVLYDQQVAQNSARTIRPDLAKSWTWNPDRTQLTFKLEEGVKWHDGRPFTARDVVCTFELLTDTAPTKLRRNPRASWYRNVDHVSAYNDYQATIHLKRPQSSLTAMLASGLSPIYPCHISTAQMRSRPIGTGVQVHPVQRVPVHPAGTQPRLLEEGPAPSRRHRLQHQQPVDAILSFIAGST